MKIQPKEKVLKMTVSCRIHPDTHEDILKIMKENKITKSETLEWLLETGVLKYIASQR